MSHETVTVEGIKLHFVHEEKDCRDRPCVIHNPTDHHMRKWALHWRDDRGIFERICEHRVGHPDPDQFAYWHLIGQEWQGVHGCDGCCGLNQEGLVNDDEEDL